MKTQFAQFNRFELEIPAEAVPACSHSGSCDADVSFWAPKINRSEDLSSEKLAAELKEYGAWEKSELENDSQNWQRIVWLACCNLAELG